VLPPFTATPMPTAAEVIEERARALQLDTDNPAQIYVILCNGIVTGVRGSPEEASEVADRQRMMGLRSAHVETAVSALVGSV
jgi:hypothetical protein